MGPLFIKPSKSTPLVILDARTGTFVVAGNAVPENAMELFGPVLDWQDRNLPKLTQGSEWRFRLSYFNTSSMKGLYQVLLRLKNSMDQGLPHRLIWDVEDNDEFMREAGDNFQEILGVPIEMRDISEEDAILENQRLNVAMQSKAA